MHDRVIRGASTFRWLVAIAAAAALACGDDAAQRTDGVEGEDAGDGSAQLPDDEEDRSERDASAADDGDAGERADGGVRDSGPATGGPASDAGGADATAADVDASAEPLDAGDAGGSQAGTNGAAAGEGGTGGTVAPPTTCYDRHPGALFCEDFETSTLPGWLHHAQGADGRTVHTTQLAHGGDGALDSIKLDPAGDSDPIYQDVLGARTSGHLYLRTYLRVPSGFAIAPASSRASLLVLGEDTGALGGLSLVLWNGALSLQINGRVVSDVKAAYALPRNRWLCVQIDFEIAAAGSARLRVDGQVIAQGARNTLMATHYERLWLGVNWIAPEQTDDVQVFYDDVFVGTSDVACD
jgi:hypothetical protein